MESKVWLGVVNEMILSTQLGDFGLARWKTGDDPEQTRVLGTLG
jgi:hypothetical protein